MSELTRRDLLRNGAAMGAGLTAAGLATDPVIARALAAAAPTGSLKDIKHVVVLMQENRSFDHMFGSYRGVRGFNDMRNRAAFTQSGYPGNGGTLQPFHIQISGGLCTPDITHDWGPQHISYDGGRNDKFVVAHETDDPGNESNAGSTMGYYNRSDLPFYYALADAFTICDHYHCSVIGPTDPNRLMAMSGTLDPAGAYGGPLVETLVGTRSAKAGTFTWTTMPDQLQARGISWKHYTSPQGGVFDSVLPFFKQFQPGAPLAAHGVVPTYPADFVKDIQNNALPQVSWIAANVQQSEHPGFSSAQAGQVAAKAVLDALTSNPAIWAKTALFINWDENGGFFDHVAPPVAPPGTPGEYLTVPTLPAAAQGISGPIGLGFRVPMLVVSPFTRGGYVCSDTFDHTSVLRFIETRFGAEVPNLSSWRRKHTGDLTSAFSFGLPPKKKAPHLPTPVIPAAFGVSGCGPGSVPVTVPPNAGVPKQEAGRAKPPVHKRKRGKH
jgi:phospholipase C